MALAGYRHSVLSPYTPSSLKNYPAEYFAGVDVSIFMDDKFIDEVRDLEFTIEERVVPVYGYASYTANAMVHGTRIVQGSFTINMRPGDYLHEMLYQDFAQSVFNSGNSHNIGFGTLGAAASATNAPNPFSDPDGFSAWEDAQKNAIWNGQPAGGLAEFITPKNLSNEPYFKNAGFTLLLVYGDIDAIDISRNLGRVRTIENVHPMRVTQIIQPTGENIVERWDFCAVDINSNNRQVSFDL